MSVEVVQTAELFNHAMARPFSALARTESNSDWSRSRRPFAPLCGRIADHRVTA